MGGVEFGLFRLSVLEAMIPMLYCIMIDLFGRQIEFYSIMIAGK